MDTVMTNEEYAGLDKLLTVVGAEVKYSLLGHPDEAIFTTPQLVMFLELIVNLVSDNSKQFTQPKEDDVQ